jgi:hypothetical protein
MAVLFGMSRESERQPNDLDAKECSEVVVWRA